MLATARMLNLAVRLGVELALLAAVTAAAWELPSTPAQRWVAATGTAVAVSAGWVATVHNDDLAMPLRMAAQATALALGVGCLLWLGAAAAAAALAFVALLNAALLAAWNQ